MDIENTGNFKDKSNNQNMIKSVPFNEEQFASKLTDLARGYAVINLDAVESNMESMHKALNPGTKMLGVVKTNAYGHGAVQIGRVLESLSYVEGYAVASAEEALEKANFYIAHDDVRKKIADNAYETIKKHYDYPVKIREMFEMSGLEYLIPKKSRR